MDRIVTKSKEYKNYLSVIKKVQEYLKSDVPPPNEVYNLYQESLSNYRNFLNDINYKMPDPKYPYLHEDKLTWKYSEVKIYGETAKTGKRCTSVENENWMYKDNKLSGL